MGKETWGIAQAPISSMHFTSLLVQDALCIVSATVPGALPGSVTVCAPLSRQTTCIHTHSTLGICIQQAYQLNFITQAWPYLVHILCGGGEENWVLILNHLRCPALNWEIECIRWPLSAHVTQVGVSWKYSWHAWLTNDRNFISLNGSCLVTHFSNTSWSLALTVNQSGGWAKVLAILS